MFVFVFCSVSVGVFKYKKERHYCRSLIKILNLLHLKSATEAPQFIAERFSNVALVAER